MFDRTIALIGQDNLDKIESKHILIIGVGGVGGYAIEALIRSGIHNITLVDYDNIDISNINRQIIAKESNVGKLKVEAWKERINEINSSVLVNTLPLKIDENNILTFNIGEIKAKDIERIKISTTSLYLSFALNALIISVSSSTFILEAGRSISTS